MLMYLYTILDRVANDTAPVFESKNDSTALRSVAQMFENPDVPENPSDYDVLCVGIVEHEPFKLTVLDQPRRLEKIPVYSHVKEDVK